MPADNLLASSTSNYTQLGPKFKLMQPHAHKQTSRRHADSHFDFSCLILQRNSWKKRRAAQNQKADHFRLKQTFRLGVGKSWDRYTIQIHRQREEKLR